MDENIAAGPERLLFHSTCSPLEYVVQFQLFQQKRLQIEEKPVEDQQDG